MRTLSMPSCWRVRMPCSIATAAMRSADARSIASSRISFVTVIAS